MILLWLIVAIGVGQIAGRKGYSHGGWFVYGLLLPPVALIQAIFMGPRLPPSSARQPVIVTLPNLKQCPECAELVQAEARMCRYCRTRFGPTIVVEASSASGS